LLCHSKKPAAMTHPLADMQIDRVLHEVPP
jgi:hypothetical protein